MVNPTFSLGIHTFNDLAQFPARSLGPFHRPSPRRTRLTATGASLCSASISQDQFRVSRRLTINAGMRHEFSTMPVDIYGRDSALPNLYDPQPTAGPLYKNPTYLNIMPRGGFAWDLFGNGTTSLRGGYGLFFNTNNQQHLIVTVTNPPATPRVSHRQSSVSPTRFRARRRQLACGLSSANIQRSHDSASTTSTSQRQLPWRTLLSVGYAGSRGTRLWRSGDVEHRQTHAPPDGTLFFPAGATPPQPATSRPSS